MLLFEVMNWRIKYRWPAPKLVVKSPRFQRLPVEVSGEPQKGFTSSAVADAFALSGL